MIGDMNMSNMFYEKVFCINCNDEHDAELDELRKIVLELTGKGISWGNEMPSRWLLLEDTLIEKKSEKIRIMTLDGVMRLNKNIKWPLPSKKEIFVFLKHLHDIGTIMHYTDDGLQELVILDPQWLIDSLKCIITAECFYIEGYEREMKKLKSTGILNKDLMESIWKKNTDERFYEFRNELVLLMQKLDLISIPKVYDERGNETNSPIYLVPCMLNSATKTFLSTFRKDASSIHIPLVFSFHDDFLPPAMVYRLLAACNVQYGLSADSKTTTIFCDAAVFKVSDDHFLLLEYKGSSLIADVLSYGRENADVGICQGVREFLDDALRFIIAPHKSIMKYTLNVACRRGVDGYGLMEWKKLRENPSLLCENHEQQPPHKAESEVLNHWLVITVRFHINYLFICVIILHFRS